MRIGILIIVLLFSQTLFAQTVKSKHCPPSQNFEINKIDGFTYTYVAKNNEGRQFDSDKMFTFCRKFGCEPSSNLPITFHKELTTYSKKTRTLSCNYTKYDTSRENYVSFMMINRGDYIA